MLSVGHVRLPGWASCVWLGRATGRRASPGLSWVGSVAAEPARGRAGRAGPGQSQREKLAARYFESQVCVRYVRVSHNATRNALLQLVA